MSENKHIVISKFGDTSVLEIQSDPIPEPAAGEVLIRVAFSGVNPIDVKTRAGLGWAAAQNKDNLPWTLGYDIAGEVIQCGTGSEMFSTGQQVAGFIGFPLEGGGYSQYITVNEAQLSAIPESVTLEAAAAIPLAGQTAIQAINQANVEEGERVLILAGAGGVGHIAVQVAIAKKAEVYTTCGEDNLDFIASLGAHAINYHFSPVSERLSDVDVLIDLVGGDAALDALKCLKDEARVVTVPTLTAETVCERATTLGFRATGMLVSPSTELLDALLYMIGIGMLKVEIESIFPMHQAAEAHAQIETGHTRGKIVLDMK